MVMRVQHVDGEYRVVLSEEAMKALHLSEGAEVEVRMVPNAEAGVRHASAEEAVESYLRTEPLHSNTYRELAK